MRVICGWCNARLPDAPGDSAAASHGMCARCAETFESTSDRSNAVPADRQEVPTEVHDDVRAANVRDGAGGLERSEPAPIALPLCSDCLYYCPENGECYHHASDGAEGHAESEIDDDGDEHPRGACFVAVPDTLPCPFCGSAGVSHQFEGEWDCWYISCRRCQASIPDADPRNAFEHWNRRAG